MNQPRPAEVLGADLGGAVIGGRMTIRCPAASPIINARRLKCSPVRRAALMTMFAQGFAADMLAGLVLAGLATVVTETVRSGGPTTKAERFMITGAGRDA